MADLAAGDITYTLQEGTQKSSPSDPHYSAVFKLTFGDGSLTYPSGGIPLTKAKLGCPTHLKSLEILDDDDALGNVYKYNYATEKIRAYLSPARTHAHDLKIIGGQAAAGTAALAWYATNILGKEAATDATIAKADSATKGGVISETLAAAALTEFTAASTAIAATTMYVRVSGY